MTEKKQLMRSFPSAKHKTFLYFMKKGVVVPTGIETETESRFRLYISLRFEKG
jgi:hypothetical protein